MVQGKRVCAFSLGLVSPCLALAAVAMGTAAILIAALYPPLVKLQASEVGLCFLYMKIMCT